MSTKNIKISSEELPASGIVRLSADVPRNIDSDMRQLEIYILRSIADKYIEQYGDEIIAKIDMNRLGEKINGVVLGKALAQLAKDIKDET